MRVKIISDGTAVGTKLVNAETGELVENVTSLTWSATAGHGHGVANLTIEWVPAEIEADIDDIAVKA